MGHLWALKHSLNHNLIPIHPARTLTIGKHTECLIKLGKRATKTSKNIISLNLSKCMTKIIVSLQKGATLKVFVTGERVTPAKERVMDSSDELVVEKENFKCEFVFRENLEIKLPVGVELDTRLFPKTWSLWKWMIWMVMRGMR